MARTIICGLLAAGLLTGALAAAASAQTGAPEEPEVITNRGYGPISAHAGRLVWSRRVRGSRAAELMSLYRGSVERVPVRPRSAGPFDVDLGPDADGRTVAVYSRCRAPASARARPAQAGPEFFKAGQYERGCDVYRYTFPEPGGEPERERRVPGLALRKVSEFSPTVWGTRIAVGRRFERRAGRRGLYGYIYAGSFGRRGSLRRLPNGPRGLWERIRGEWIGGAGPGQLDLAGRQLAVAWQYDRRHNITEDVETITQIRLIELGGGSRLIARASDDCCNVTSPIIDGGGLYYGFTGAEAAEDATDAIVRYDLTTRQGSACGISYVESIARTEDNTYSSDGRQIVRERPEPFPGGQQHPSCLEEE